MCTENLARRAPSHDKGKLVGPLLAQEAGLPAQTHLEWPHMSARKVPYAGRFICGTHPDVRSILLSHPLSKSGHRAQLTALLCLDARGGCTMNRMPHVAARCFLSCGAGDSRCG